ncbi:hypothetical protein VNI00_018500 [Paramarasmius palmivorus]|uniref:Uncharacterized protein n=1 Tax=Paramarasmius palmivorus TaxID=297713 RepID=A0AAW0AWR8_9AGAR
MLPQKYEVEAAAKRLDEISKQRAKDGFIANNMSGFAEKIDWKVPTAVHQYGGKDNVNWRICAIEDEVAVEEVVFTVQGIIVQCELPPVTKQFGRYTTPRNLQQRVVIAGLGSPAFEEAAKGFARLNAFLRCHLREDEAPSLMGQYQNYNTIEVSNRYFTSARFANGEAHIPFTHDVDPRGILEEIKGDKMVHVTENVVEYYERIVRNDDDQRQEFVNIPPSRITKGDIVEVQLTITLAEVQQQHKQRDNAKGQTDEHRTCLVLRGITLLDGQFSEKSRMFTATAPAETKAPKRKIGYEAEATAGAQEKMKRMAIDRE